MYLLLSQVFDGDKLIYSTKVLKECYKLDISSEGAKSCGLPPRELIVGFVATGGKPIDGTISFSFTQISSCYCSVDQLLNIFCLVVGQLSTVLKD
jgi:hypothetical protein